MNRTKFAFVFIFILSICHAGFCAENKTSSNIDSLKSRLELIKGDERFDILLNLSELTRRNDPDEAMTYMEQAKEWIDENEINEDLFLYLKNLSGVKLSQHLFQEAITIAQKAIQLNIQVNDPADHIDTYKYIGKAYNLQGEYDKAQQAFFKGLRASDSLRLDKKATEFINDIGATYLALEDNVKSEKYLLLAIEKAKETSHETIHTMATGNLAIFYTNQKRYDEAINMFLECIEKAKSTGNKYVLGGSYNNLAAIYQEQQKYKKSIEYYKKALIISEEASETSSIILRHCNLGESYTSINNFKLAEKHINIGLTMGKSSEYKDKYMFALLRAVGLFEKTGNLEKALAYHKEYSSIKDSLLNEKRINVVAELEEKYESEKKEKEILALSNDKESAKKRERTLIQTILLLCFALFALGALFYFLRLNHIKNSIIQNKNLKIASDKIELLEKGKAIIALESLVKGQENERERLAKEMHDGLGGLLAISHSKLTNLNAPEMKTNEVLSEARDLIGDAYNQVRQISHNLMPLDLEKFGIVAALGNMIQRINQQNEIFVDFRTYHFDLILNNKLGLNIYRISQEALANILKYAKANNVLIELIQHKEKISLTIEDDGIGFNLDPKASGIGIRNMRNRTELLDGKFSIESRVSQGTSVTVLFPHFSGSPTPVQI